MEPTWETSWESQHGKHWEINLGNCKNATNYNPGHNSLEISVFQGKFDSPKIKRYLILTITDFAHDLFYKYRNDLRLRSLEN